MGFVAIAGARIEVDPSPLNPGRILKTDSKGHSSLDPAAGIHTISITSPGFYPWTHQINVPSTGSKTIMAELRTAPICDVEIIPLRDDIDVIRPPDPALDLPAVDIDYQRDRSSPTILPRKHWWQRLFGH